MKYWWLIVTVAFLLPLVACVPVDRAADRPGKLTAGEVRPSETDAAALASHTLTPSGLPGGPDRHETVIVRMRTEDYEPLALREAVHAIDYGSFVWLELAPAQFAALQASGVRYVRPPRPTVLQFQNCRFDTRSEEPDVPPDLRADFTGRGPQLYVLQYVGPPKDAWRSALEAIGVEFIRSHPPNAYVVWMTPETAETAAAQEHVRWVGPHHPAFKLNPGLAEAARRGAGDNETTEVCITIYDDRQPEGTVDQTIQALRELGGLLVDRREGSPVSAPVEAVRFRLSVPALLDTARLEAVVDIDNVAQPVIEE